MVYNPQHNPQGKQNCGTGGGTRTHNLRFRRPLLYPLSYARLPFTIAYARPLDKRRFPCAYSVFGRGTLARDRFGNEVDVELHLLAHIGDGWHVRNDQLVVGSVDDGRGRA